MRQIYKKYVATVALIWAACFLLCFFIYMLVIAPQKQESFQIEKELDEAKQTYYAIVKAAQKETSVRLSKEIENLRNRLEEFVIDFDDLANLTFDMSKIAAEKKITSFSSKSKDSSGVSSIPNCDNICEHNIKVGFTAGFNQFASFLNALERNRPVLFVDEFTIKRSKMCESGHQVNMSLSICVRK